LVPQAKLHYATRFQPGGDERGRLVRTRYLRQTLKAAEDARLMVRWFIALSVILGLGVGLSGVAPASASTPCPPGQPPGRPPGQPPGRPGPPRGRPPQYPPGQCEMRMSRSTVAAGQSVTAAGEGFTPGSPVRFALGAQDLQAATTDGAGAFVADVTIPVSTAPNTYPVTATGPDAAGGTRVLAATLTVTPAAGVSPASSSSPSGAAAASSPKGGLPRTGSSGSVPLTVGSVGLIVAGTLAVLGARRRRRRVL